MIKKLLFGALGMAALTAGAQMNATGDGFNLHFQDGGSQCLINAGLPNNGGIMNGDGSSLNSKTSELTADGMVLTSGETTDGTANATWYSIPAVYGEGETASCQTLNILDQGINMTANSKITVTAKSSVAGASLELFLGGVGQWGPQSSTYNDGSGNTIAAGHAFKGTDAETFTIDFNAIDATIWSGWAGKNKIQSVGYRSGTEGAVFTITQIKFGALADAGTVDPTDPTDPTDPVDPGTGGASCTSVKDDGKAQATFYKLLEDGRSSVVTCSFDAVADIKGTKYGALETATLQGQSPAKYCGMCVEMTGLAGTATVHVVDECPDCHEHNTGDTDIDLSPAAFSAVVGAESIGRSDITWKEVSCPWSSPIHVIVQGSNQYYAKVIIGNHVNRIAKVEVKFGGEWLAMERQKDNSWIKSAINGTSKDFKVTDIYGESIEVTGVDFSADPQNGKTAGTKNFSACKTTDAAEINTLDYITTYPNPASDVVTFDGIGGVTEIVVVNTLGNVVAIQVLTGSTDQISLDVANLTAGIYVVKFTNGNGVSTSTFVKQ